MDVATTWGTTPEEREPEYGCDEYLADAQVVCWRGIDVEAPVSSVFRRLCQLRVAPYSYDWIDNLGRRSPDELTPGLEHLEVGQRFMTIFELAAYEPDRDLTLVTRRMSVVGEVAVTYQVVAIGVDRSRLVAKLRWRMPGRLGRVLARPAAWADLVMMRRQFLNLRALAERDHRRAVALTSWQGARVPRGSSGPGRTRLLPPPPSHR